MKEKHYANLVREIFGSGILNEDREFDQDPAFAQTVEQIVRNAWAPRSLEHIAVDITLEGKNKEDFAAYIRAHAEEIANRYHALAFRYLRQPRQSGQLRPYIRFPEDRSSESR